MDDLSNAPLHRVFPAASAAVPKDVGRMGRTLGLWEFQRFLDVGL